MAVTFHIPGPLQNMTGGEATVLVDGSPHSVKEALTALWGLHPGLRDRVTDEQGQIRQHVNIFVGAECIRFAGGLDTKVPEGSEIFIVPAVSGG